MLKAFPDFMKHEPRYSVGAVLGAPWLGLSVVLGQVCVREALELNHQQLQRGQHIPLLLPATGGVSKIEPEVLYVGLERSPRSRQE